MNNSTYFTETNIKPNLQTAGVYKKFFDIFTQYNNTSMDDKEVLLQVFNKAWEHYKYFMPDELSTRLNPQRLQSFYPDTNNDTYV